MTVYYTEPAGGWEEKPTGNDTADPADTVDSLTPAVTGPAEPMTPAIERPAEPLTPDDGPERSRGKRLALISAAAGAVLAVGAIAIVEGTGKDQPTAKGLARAGSPRPGMDPGMGAFPAAGGNAGGAPGPGSNTSTGSAAAPGSGSPTSTGTARNPGGQRPSSQASHATSSAPTTSKTSASRTTSKPAPSTKPTTPPAAHKAPAPLSPGEVKVNIPDWYLVAGIDVSWNAHPDATGYIVHFTASDGTNENVSVPDPWYSYQVDKGVTTCVQVKAVNQYGETPFSPSPMYCVDPGPHQTH